MMSVINLNQYRSIAWPQRVCAMLAYVVFCTIYNNLFARDGLIELVLMLVCWVLCSNRQLATPAFVRYHLIQGLASLILLSLFAATLMAGLGFLAALLNLFSLPVGWLSDTMGRLQTGSSVAVAVFCGYNLWQCGKGLQHHLPLAGYLAQRWVY